MAILQQPLRTYPLAGVLQRYEALIFPLGVFLVLRIVTALAALNSVQGAAVTLPDWFYESPSYPAYMDALPEGARFYRWLEPWNRWDTPWYVKIAMDGYHPGDIGIVFPPLYPILVRAVTPFVNGNYLLAALLVSNIACLIAFILLYRLTLRVSDSPALARTAVVVMAAFPTAFFLLAGYTESLFLALALATFLAASERRWWLAGVLAALAALCRLQGLALCLPMAWYALMEYRKGGVQAALRALPAVAGAAIGFALWLLYLNINQLGAPDSVLLNAWHIQTRPPWQSVMVYLERLASSYALYFENENAASVLFVLVFGVGVAAWRFRPPYALYAFGTLMILLMRYTDWTQFNSLFRYTLTIFPAFMAAAILLKRPWLLIPYTLGAGYWQLQFLQAFTRWQFAG
jgi:hypothetical protein